jgi:hypothetical protein
MLTTYAIRDHSESVRKSSLTFLISASMILGVMQPECERILDQSDATILNELSRLELERKRLVSPLDDRIAKLRSILTTQKTLPLAGTADDGDDDRDHASCPDSDEPTRPRGEIQNRIYEFLLVKPDAGYSEIIDAVYGEISPQNHNAARNAIAALKAAGWISGERGHWTIERRVGSTAG